MFLMSVVTPSLHASLLLKEVKSIQDLVPYALDSFSPLGVVTHCVVHFPKLTKSYCLNNMVGSSLILRVLDAPLVEVQVEVKGLSEETVTHAFKDHCGIVLLVGVENASVFPSIYGGLQVPIEKLSESLVYHLPLGCLDLFSFDSQVLLSLQCIISPCFLLHS